ncbi:lmo0937 family membrane protein [Tamlana agarivorans]|uniref:Lmo0937 family membrane protein n=1 Tax=Pseudotamlana agarivorans TaxID=481183 RepID=A0ACC5U4X3_9FLAO|nr:lmo0937 family membrane protein [Tamlana agarivorans]MBU2949371.1 lmo0937 family membrane protein [Tamlana agarivorans]
MLRTTGLIIILCLIAWAIGFFVFSVGLVIHLLLLVAVIVASKKVLEN